MRALKKSLIALIAGLCVAAAAAVVALDPPSMDQFAAAHTQYNADLIDTLLAEGTPRAMTLAATAITYGVETSETSVERQRALLTRAAEMAPDDAWVQWIAAAYYRPTTTLSEPALALQRLEPDNGAVWLFQLAAASEAKDEKGITEALARIGAAPQFDDHFAGSVGEWLKVVRAHPIPQPGIGDSEMANSQIPLIMAFSRAATTSMASHFSTTRACKSSVRPLTVDRRDACLATGRLMLTESNTLISMRVGAALLRMAGSEDAVEATRNADYFMKEAGEVSRSVQLDPIEVGRYLADWLQTGSEIQAMKNQLSRAGIPLLPPSDWNDDPYGNLARISQQKDG